jgi:hypothetical protein
MVDADMFALMVKDNGLRLVSQVDSWGPGNRCNTKLYRDCISMLVKPL